ncbi:hypothetical protein [Paenibacillus methanolicus]|uniref:Import inner membrane translocase subunit Tim44 n=1 Tax=Paenibacillus methanolicus TaxID=582686 RepID=A0A5S5C1V8_9BACL|nr:hypothetical protein [Paenibacillus methanolicus]TYP72588.1 hypothetical protein BCM02_108243 [Paenibacillus methanolicus]
MKKSMLLIMAFTLIFAVFAGSASAKPRGGSFKSPKQSYTQTPKKTDNVQQSTSGTKNTASTAATTKRGFSSGGSFMKGLMIGGLAGMLFGSMFMNMGFMGDFLGLLVNLFAIYLLFVAIRGIVRYFRNRRKPHHPNDQYRGY